METHVFAAVLFAALLHAGWNALVKIGLDRVSTILLLSLVQGALVLPLVPFSPLPAPDAWIWIGAGALLHVAYKIFLVQAYAHSDLSQAYPLARGTAPVITTAVSMVFLGAAIAPPALLAIGLISAGILIMALKGASTGRMRGKALFWALGTAGFTAAYTLVDGVGARIAGTATGFVLWLFLCDALCMAAYTLATRGRAAFIAVLPAWKIGTLAGAMSLGSYWIAIWAFTEAPIAMVAALRESSILFAVLIAAVILREPVGRWRWTSALTIAGGVALMKT